MYYLWAKGFKIGTVNLFKYYVGVPIPERIEQENGQLSFSGLLDLVCPYLMPSSDPEEQIFKYSFLVKQPFSYNGLIISQIFFIY